MKLGCERSQISLTLFLMILPRSFYVSSLPSSPCPLSLSLSLLFTFDYSYVMPFSPGATKLGGSAPWHINSSYSMIFVLARYMV